MEKGDGRDKGVDQLFGNVKDVSFDLSHRRGLLVASIGITCMPTPFCNCRFCSLTVFFCLSTLFAFSKVSSE